MLRSLGGGDGRPASKVVAPSLPNYCFSDGVKKPGFVELKHYAETCNKLMHKLGYKEDVFQRGDWGLTSTCSRDEQRTLWIYIQACRTKNYVQTWY
ncbi:hypothetical protein WAI453_007932 [Rhynchosporium graminicola]|uniref:Uncharacterized protein n=1 Tax=Rhynchosporium graminicola TaxID=2792576 RepID=A0A1E1KUM8_9HELO|nr:uncharacterized protein RCO7_03593 [Rhynchosporium commune]